MPIAAAKLASPADRYIQPRDVEKLFGMSQMTTRRLLAQGVEAGSLKEIRVPHMKPRYRMSQVLAMAAVWGLEPLGSLE